MRRTAADDYGNVMSLECSHPATIYLCFLLKFFREFRRSEKSNFQIFPIFFVSVLSANTSESDEFVQN